MSCMTKVTDDPGVDRLYTAVRRFFIEGGRLDEAVARKHNISLADLHALEHLEFSGGLTPGQLGARLGLTSGTVTALADRLERLGFLQRTPHPSDRRSTMLCLTALAQGFGEDAYAAFGDDMTQAAAALSASQQRAVAAFLERGAEIAASHVDRQLGDSPPGAAAA